MEPNDTQEGWTFLGEFAPQRVTHLLDRLADEGLAFEVEADDGIHRVNVIFGSSGLEARVRVWVAEADAGRAIAIRDRELKMRGEV